jgi:(2Fe-2S) ferredoxin
MGRPSPHRYKVHQMPTDKRPETPPAAEVAAPARHFDVWVCHGRLCTANGSDVVAVAAAAVAPACVTVLRGGCYGLCDLGPNVVVRRFVDDHRDPAQIAADRLSLTYTANEHVYCGVGAADVDAIVSAHAVHDAPLVRLTRAVRERELTPKSLVEERMRALRDRRNKPKE